MNGGRISPTPPTREQASLGGKHARETKLAEKALRNALAETKETRDRFGAVTRRYLDEADESKQESRIIVVIDAQYKRAKAGDTRAAEFLATRAYGKPAQAAIDRDAIHKHVLVANQFHHQVEANVNSVDSAPLPLVPLVSSSLETSLAPREANVSDTLSPSTDAAFGPPSGPPLAGGASEVPSQVIDLQPLATSSQHVDKIDLSAEGPIPPIDGGV
jgi:hypothetical protein